MSYCVLINPGAEITFIESEMILTIHSDATHLVAAKIRSIAAEYHFFGNKASLEKRMENYLVD